MDLSNIGTDLIIGIGSALSTLVGGYMVIRERILKSEIKLENIYDYIDQRNELIDARIKNIEEDMHEFKEINKETTKSLTENTQAIRELKFVLTVLREQLKNGLD